MPLTNRSEAKEGGFAQVRAALKKFKMDVTSAEFGQWGGKLVDEDTGKPLIPREFLEIGGNNFVALETTEPLSMEVLEWNFRVNCSDYKGSFWVEKFLESADKFNILIPDGILNQSVTFERVTLEAVNKDGVRNPKFDSTNYVIVGIEPIQGGAPVSAPPQAAPAPAPNNGGNGGGGDASDPMALCVTLALGKTEQQFRTAAQMNPGLSALLPLIKAGHVTQSLVNDGKLMLQDDGNGQQIYRIPG